MCVQTEVLLLETLMHVTYKNSQLTANTQHVCKRNASRCCEVRIQHTQHMYMAKPHV